MITQVLSPAGSTETAVGAGSAGNASDRLIVIHPVAVTDSLAAAPGVR